MHLCSVIAKCLKLFFFTFLALSQMSLCASVRYEITPQIEAIYQQIWEMNFDQAEIAVANVLIEDPENLIVELVADYIDFSRIFVTDDLTSLNQYQDDVDKRIEKIKKHECASPYYYFARAELYLHRALVRTKSGATIRAGWDINKANKLLNKCKEKYPDFKHTDKSLSVIHTLMGSVKGIQKSLIKLLTSLDGSIEQGISEIETLYTWNKNNPSLWSNEIVTVYTLMLGHIQKDWSGALEVVNHLDADKKDTPLGVFLMATTAIRAGKNEMALGWLQQLQDFNGFHYLEYLLGDALLYKGDGEAVIHYKKYLSEHRGQDFIKAAHQKLAWSSLIFHDDETAYSTSLNKILNVGSAVTGADQQAQFAAETQLIPNRILLQARLFYDGGYFEKTLSLLTTFDSVSSGDFEKIEYHYRMARVLERLAEIERCKKHYKSTIELGRDDKRYYACNSALQLANIHFKNQEWSLAQNYVDQVLKMKPSERRTDLHQEARLLKDRMKEK